MDVVTNGYWISELERAVDRIEKGILSTEYDYNHGEEHVWIGINLCNPLLTSRYLWRVWWGC